MRERAVRSWNPMRYLNLLIVISKKIWDLKKRNMIHVSVDGWRSAIIVQNLDNKNFGIF